MEKEGRIFVAGHRGMVGSAIVRCLEKNGYGNFITRTRRELDLTCQEAVEDFFAAEKIEYLFIAAAKVGGILANDTYPAEFIYKNLMIECNLIHAAWKYGLKRLLFLGSSCIYPRESPQPMKEEHLLTGPLEPTNEPYAIAKIAGIKLCESYNRQYDTDFRSVMPTNLYGPNDNYDLAGSHVLPAMIRKFHLAKLACSGFWEEIQSDEITYGPIPDDILANLASLSMSSGHALPDRIETLAIKDGEPPAAITLWGSGTPCRELLYVEDLAEAALFVMNLQQSVYQDQTPPMLSHINIGTGEEISMLQLAETVRSVIGYSGKIRWDRTRPDGMMLKRMDTGKINRFGWHPAITLADGIALAYENYLAGHRHP